MGLVVSMRLLTLQTPRDGNICGFKRGLHTVGGAMSDSLCCKISSAASSGDSTGSASEDRVRLGSVIIIHSGCLNSL